ncbi:MAG: class I adenylate-forming enzyme family protein [Acidimicrobiia bacterium]
MRPPLPPASLAATTAGRPGAPAVITADRMWTYAELDAEIARWEHGPLSGLESGMRVGIVAHPAAETIAAMWAAWRCGLAVLPVDPRAAGGSTDEPSNRDPPLIDPPHTPAASASPARRAKRAVAAPSDVMCLPATSGSAGGRKLVRITYGNAGAAVAASQERLGNEEDDAWLLSLPLWHVGGLSVLWRCAAAGGAVRLITRFGGAAVAGVISRGEVRWASFVPTMLHRVLQARGSAPDRMRGILLGGAGASPSLVRRALESGLPVLATYGMTEACSQIATVDPERPGDSLRGVGMPLPGLRVRIVDDAGSDVSAGSSGEITIDGPNVAAGYDGEPDLDGPFPTGDLGRFGSDGRLVVLGRRDDAIVTGGEKVHPRRVEDVLGAHPGVESCAVFGVADPEWGHAVTAVVVGDVAVAELRGFARSRLAPHELPKRWRFVEELPLLASGKVDHRALAEPEM